MKVLNTKIDHIGKEMHTAPEKSADVGPLKAPTKQSSEDRVELSTQALDLQKMAELAKSAPEIRSEQVAAIRQQLQSGNYEISASGIASRMLAEETIDTMA